MPGERHTDGQDRRPLTSGGIVEVAGSKIKSVNDDGTSIGKVVLNNTETQTETDITLLTINNPSFLMLSILASLARRHIQTEGRDLLQHQPAAEIRTYLNLVVGTLTSGRGQTTNPSGNEDYEYSEDSFG